MYYDEIKDCNPTLDQLKKIWFYTIVQVCCCNLLQAFVAFLVASLNSNNKTLLLISLQKL